MGSGRTRTDCAGHHGRQNSSTEAREPGKVVLKQDESDKTLEITINQAGFSNSMSLDATYSTNRCKVLVIEPTI